MLTKEQTKLWRKWIKALESGEYRQAKGHLQGKNGTGKDAFCCLGVACDLVKAEVGGEWTNKTSWGIDPDVKRFKLPSGKTDVSFAPEPVVKLFGFEDSMGFQVKAKLSYNQVPTNCNIAAVNDAQPSKKGPYSNVLPYIKRKFEKIKYVAPKAKTTKKVAKKVIKKVKVKKTVKK